VGASFVLQGRAPLAERERVLDFLVGKGLDVNRIDMHKLRPLHAAVLSNSPEEVVLLLRHGARPELPDERYGQTPLELALALERDERRQVGREDLIAMLRSAH
jgi:ankyrin repeat protein